MSWRQVAIACSTGCSDRDSRIDPAIMRQVITDHMTDDQEGTKQVEIDATLSFGD